MSFYDEITKKWICQDPCLKQIDSQLCGETDHLTNFAILLNGDEAGDDPCGSSDDIPILFWVSLGMCILSVCCILIAIVLIEIKFYLKKHKNGTARVINTSEVQERL